MSEPADAYPSRRVAHGNGDYTILLGRITKVPPHDGVAIDWSFLEDAAPTGGARSGRPPRQPRPRNQASR